MRTHLTTAIILGFLCLFCFATGGQPLMAQEAPRAVEKAASDGLPVLLEALPEDIIGQFNFFRPEELDKASLGTPFQEFTIDPQDILNYEADTPIETIVVPTNHWYFPVTVYGQVRTLLTVGKMGDTWEAVGLGSSGLAREWDDKVTQYSAAKGYTHKLVTVFQASAHFILLGGTGGDKLLSLGGGRMAIEAAVGGEPMDPAEVISQLKRPVQLNIQTYK